MKLVRVKTKRSSAAASTVITRITVQWPSPPNPDSCVQRDGPKREGGKARALENSRAQIDHRPRPSHRLGGSRKRRAEKTQHYIFQPSPKLPRPGVPTCRCDANNQNCRSCVDKDSSADGGRLRTCDVRDGVLTSPGDEQDAVRIEECETSTPPYTECGDPMARART